MHIAIDTGGTFTDCVYLKGGVPVVLKLLSTPDDPARSVLEAVRRIAQEPVSLRHGTTIGTNALLERKGASVAFVTTAGFEDTIAIGRQARQDLYNWLATPKPCLVPPQLRFGVNERVSAEGETLLVPPGGELEELREKIRSSGAESIAISLLFSFANPENEKSVASCLRALDLPITVSCEVLPEFREYERASTVVVNAYLAPKAGGYISRLQSALASDHQSTLFVMQSSGGIISGKAAAEEPVRTVLSGPAGGVIGAQRLARMAGLTKIISFDMGGTSTDVSLIDSDEVRTTSEAKISDMPISVPMLDIHTVGAGGGSLAWFDRGGILHVGPASAGADPGPVCYGRGEQPTVTDANLVLGRLDGDLALAGALQPDADRAAKFMDRARGPLISVQDLAAGILRLAEAEMEKAIRLISIERGYDPREFALLCFGGAGPLHACSLARALAIPKVLVPVMPGALSALGILMADIVRDYSRTVMLKAAGEQVPSALEEIFVQLERQGEADFHSEHLVGVSSRTADIRYAGQGYELNVNAGPSMLRQFHAAHRRRYGYADENRPLEIVNLRVRMIASSGEVELPRGSKVGRDSQAARSKTKSVWFDQGWLETPIFDRARLAPGNLLGGPAIVHEYSATTVIPPGCMAEVDEYSNIVISV
jgi:N-methylhydantoinase A